MSQTLTYTIGADKRALVSDAQDFHIDFTSDNSNWVQARQYEDSMRQVFVNVKNQDGTPYNLTGTNIWFEGILPDKNHKILDAKHAVILDAANGQFRFDMPKQAFAVAGSYQQAFFRIVRDGASVTTLEFDLEVLADKVISNLVARDYITPFEDLYDQLEEIINKADSDIATQLANWTTKFQDKYNELVQLGTDVTNHLADVQSRLNDLEAQIKSNGLFTDGEADAFKQAIESKLTDLGKVYEHTYPTLADLQADKNIISGQVVKTGGYYALNDGGSAIYDVTDAKPDGYYETLQNGLYAELRYTPKVINVAQFGVSPSQSDNYNKLQMIFDNYSQDANIYFPNGLYKFSKTLILDKTYCRLVGDARTELQKTTTDLSGYTCIFNGRTIDDLDKTDVALIVGPANNQNETVYHHQIKFESMRFISPDTANSARSNYGIVAIGTAYMSFDSCFIYGYYLNMKQYESFGLNLTQTQSEGALLASLYLDKCIHVSANGCVFEGIRPQSSAVTLTNKSIATIADSTITMNGIAADSNSDLTLVGCSFETNYQTFRATAGSTIDVTGGDIERHQDPTNNADTPLIYCTDGSKVSVTNAKWRWQNYSGEPTWDHLSAYETNTGCKIVVINCQFNGFPNLSHYDGGADYVVWDNDLDIYKKYTAQVNPMDGVTVQGQTLTRDYVGQCFLNIGFTTTKDFNYMDPLMSFPPSYIPWDGCYIQFLQQDKKVTYQAFTEDGQIKVYDTVPSGIRAILTFSYQAKD